ncbi:hypothetical protein WJX75_008866 [Coccomyxa subellipsoidea]|uniref:Lipid-binding serum glycoprotein C-terminal domain-containing protein n=1 Tax=Coccomyxa subellipsoidea TaxID=248742 RepID=A0ABR2Z1R2_9CHLO
MLPATTPPGTVAESPNFANPPSAYSGPGYQYDTRVLIVNSSAVVLSCDASQLVIPATTVGSLTVIVQTVPATLEDVFVTVNVTVPDITMSSLYTGFYSGTEAAMLSKIVSVSSAPVHDLKAVTDVALFTLPDFKIGVDFAFKAALKVSVKGKFEEGLTLGAELTAFEVTFNIGPKSAYELLEGFFKAIGRDFRADIGEIFKAELSVTGAVEASAKAPDSECGCVNNKEQASITIQGSSEVEAEVSLVRAANLCINLATFYRDAFSSTFRAPNTKDLPVSGRWELRRPHL